jgi:gluconate 2-dehydrogenase gamma chain
MSDISRRDALRRLGLVLAATGFVDRAAAQEVHQMAGEARAAGGGMYSPKALSAHDFKTLERLTDLIVPVENGAPGALAAGAAAWIDMMASENAELKGIYTKGLGWLDTTMVQRGQKDFVSAPPARQTELLDLIAYRRNQTPELAPGIEFFSWARRMTVDAFYTSEIGIKDIDYRGNTPQSTYAAPTQAIEYALKKSGLG